MSICGLIPMGSAGEEYFYQHGQPLPPSWVGVSLAQMTERLHRGTITQDEYEAYCREWEATHPHYHQPDPPRRAYLPTRQHIRHSWPAYALVERLAYIAGWRPLTEAEQLRGWRIITRATETGEWF